MMMIDHFFFSQQAQNAAGREYSGSPTTSPGQYISFIGPTASNAAAVVAVPTDKNNLVADCSAARLLSAGCCDGGGRAAATAAAHSYFSHYPRIAGHQCVNPIARMFMSQIAVIICLALVGSANVVVAGKCSDHVLSMKADGGWSGFDGEESGSSNQYGKAYISSFLPLMFPGMFSLAAGRMCILCARV